MAEEIIIDGVNVAGCMNYSFKEFINFTECPDCCGEYLDKRCDNHPNCYYKQLKRLEQERNDLQERLLTLADTYQETRNVCKRLEQENKELKNKNICRETCEYFKRICNENTQLINYRSALEEILESAKFAQCLPCVSGNLEDCLNCNDDITNNGQFCMEKRIRDIKTKCVEVLNHSEG